jgi:F0F1-type ATP synthase alpha subunit
MPISEQVVVIWCGANGHLDNLPVNSLADFEDKLLNHIRSEFPEILEGIINAGEMNKEEEANLTKVVSDFNKDFSAKLPQG